MNRNVLTFLFLTSFGFCSDSLCSGKWFFSSEFYNKCCKCAQEGELPVPSYRGSRERFARVMVRESKKKKTGKKVRASKEMVLRPDSPKLPG